MADACDEEGLAVPEFTERTKAALRDVVPYFGMVSNPVDLTGQVLAEADLMRRCVAAALADERIDAVVVFLSLMHKLGGRVSEEIISAAAQGSKPVAISWIANPGEPVERLRAAGMCVTTAPGTAAVRALAHAYRYNMRSLALPRGSVDPTLPRPNMEREPGPGEPVNALSGVEARRLLDRLGVPVMPHQEASTPDEAVAAARRIGFPVALKVERPVVLHKTEIDALRLGLSDVGEVASAAESLLATAGLLSGDATPTVLVERMAERGVEMLVSVARDPQFGMTLHLGLGGTRTEIYRDISTRLLPVNDADMRAMIADLRGSRLLDGFRGAPPADVDALVASMRSLAQGVMDGCDRVRTIEINPLVVFEKGRGCVAVDALVVEDRSP
jgi:acyl-CoA synthetase (NDP forming)